MTNNKTNIGIRLIIYLLIIAASAILLFLAFYRHFNFDEFNCIYMSSFFLRGEKFYTINGSGHFPLRKIINAAHIFLFGKTHLQLLLGRIVSLIFLFITSLFTYKITKLKTDKITAAGAALITITSYVFVLKGIEIRHDVFNMAFCVVSVYLFLKYSITKKSCCFYFSALLGGLALATTQKSIIWLSGICFGILIYFILKKQYKSAIIYSFQYFTILFLPVIIIFLILIIGFNNDANTILQNTVFNTFGYLLPEGVSKSFRQFPYSKRDIWEPILRQDFVLFFLLIPAAVLIIHFILKKKKHFYTVLFFWFLSGFSFYLIMKRPFYQSLLPTMPAIAIIVSFFSGYLSKITGKKTHTNPRLIFLTMLILILAFPIYSSLKHSFEIQNERYQAPFQYNKKNNKQLVNASFCVDNLDIDDKVVCFTHQQLFYRPVFCFFKKNIHGLELYQIPPEIFKSEIINEKCKLLIFDYRTRILHPEVLKVLTSMYIYSGIGDIFLPGSKIPANKKIVSEIFIPGKYRIHNGPVTIDGNLTDESIILNKGKHTIENKGDNYSLLIWDFRS